MDLSDLSRFCLSRFCPAGVVFPRVLLDQLAEAVELLAGIKVAAERCGANPELKESATVDFKMFNADSVLAGLEFNLYPIRGGIMPRPVFEDLVVVDGWNFGFLIS